MTATLDAAWARHFIDLANQSISANKDELTELDRQIGDGDHGANMARGFTAAAEAVTSSDAGTVGAVFKTVATTLMSTIGGAAGPLYGTAFLRAAKVTDSEAVESDGVVAFIEAALGGIVARGKAEPGDKTMVDAWTPALDAAKQAASQGADPAVVLRAAATAADGGATATIDLEAHKGRASYLGERSIGHQDPGATSTALLLNAAAEAAESA